MVAVDERNQTIDIFSIKIHEPVWGERSKQRIIYDQTIILPEEPVDQDCVNWGLPEEDQIFRKTFVPPQVRNPGANHEEIWTEEQIDYFVDKEYKLRSNGYWIFIKGEKIWIPGGFYLFLNHWKLISLQDIRFIYTALELWWVWIDTVRDPNWDGLADFKCRQIGDTEFVIFMIWEYATRVSGQKCCMQSALGDDHVEKTYDRLVYGQKEMIWYFKPINRGSDSPADGLEFKYPTEAITTGKIKAQQQQSGTNVQANLQYEYPELNSEILFGPYTERHFDGGTYGRAYLDEFGKAIKFDPQKIIKVLQPAINSRILEKQVGKIIATSTVEEMAGGKSLKWSKKFWDQCKPKMTETGMTSLNRMRRIFRSALDRAPVDRWGHAKKEAEKKWIQDTSKGYLEAGDMLSMRIHERSNPLTIEQVFISANDNSQFDVDKLAMRMHYLNSEEYINPRTGNNIKPWVRGNLRWKDDNIKTGIVVWEPNSKGRWLISHHPEEFGCQPNAKVAGVMMPKPANSHIFKCGVDPYEQKSVLSDDVSMGGIAVKRVLDATIDGIEGRYWQFTDEARGIIAGDPVDFGMHFKTNKYCCTYLYRWADPEHFYMDVILTNVYYGCQYLPEKNKANGLLKFTRDIKHDLYIVDVPNMTNNVKNQSEQDGVTATEKTKDEYFGYLMTLSTKWANTIDHPDILEQMLTMNYANATTKDLGVAVGWTEYHCKIPVFYKPKTEAQKTSKYYSEHLV